MHEETEIKVSGVMNSLEGMQKARAPEHLWEAIRAKAETPASGGSLASAKTIWLVAASMTVLLLLNLGVARQFLMPDKSSAAMELMKEYGINNDTYDIYK